MRGKWRGYWIFLALAGAGLAAGGAAAQVIPFAVYDDSQSNRRAQIAPAVAYDSAGDRYIVAFPHGNDPNCAGLTDCNKNVTAVWVNGSGAVTASRDVSATSTVEDKEAAVAYNSASGGYMSAFMIKDDRDSCADPNVNIGLRADIYVQRLDAQGALVGTRINVSNTTDVYNIRPRIAFLKSNNPSVVPHRYLVTWQAVSTSNICSNMVASGEFRGVANSNWRVKAAILSETGAVVVGPFIPSMDPNVVQQYPDVEVDPEHGWFFVVWGDRRLATESVRGQMISATGVRRFPSFDPIIGDSDFHDRWPRLAYNPASDEWVAVWYGAKPPYADDLSGTIYAQRMREDAFWVGTRVTIYNPYADGRGHGHPEITWCDARQRYWVAWQSDLNSTNPISSRYKPFSSTLTQVADSVLVSGVKAPVFADRCRADGRTILVYESQANDPQGDIRARFIAD